MKSRYLTKKIVTLVETICVGSLNWLPAAQDAADPYSNVELSIVLQGPKAKELSKTIIVIILTLV